MTLMELIDAALRAATYKATAESIWSDSSKERIEYCEAYDEARTAVVEAVEKLERDAARYRWLRDNATHDVEPEHIVVMYRALSFVWDSPSFEAGKRLAPVPLDAAIDAAMKEATNGQGN